MANTLQKVTQLRAAGQYGKALAELSRLSVNPLQASQVDVDVLLVERAICHFSLHQFLDLLDDVEQFQALRLPEDGRPSCLLRLLYALARVHTDVALKEAWDEAQSIGRCCIALKPVSNLDSIDIEILCYYRDIELLAEKFLDVKPADFSPTEKSLHSLCVALYDEGRINDLVSILRSQSVMSKSNFNVALLQNMIAFLSLEDYEMQINLKVMLAQTLLHHDQISLALQQLHQVQTGPLSKSNPEQQLRAYYLNATIDRTSIKSCPWQETDLFDGSYDRRTTQLLEMELADFYLRNAQITEYVATVQKLSETSHLLQLPSLSHTTAAMCNDPPTDQMAFSTFLFWQWYMQHIEADVKASGRSGLVMESCRCFIDKIEACSVPEMRYTLMIVLADHFERIGDPAQVLLWRHRANEVAQTLDDEEIQQEAKCALLLAFSDDNVSVLDDPHGVKKAQLAAGQIADLKLAFKDSKARNDAVRQFKYAKELARKELDQELRQQQYPWGEEWYPQALQSLEQLPLQERSYELLGLRFMVAHAQFEFGDLQSSILSLHEIINDCARTGSDNDTFSRALFTCSRACLQLYKRTGNLDHWLEAESQLLQCKELNERIQDFGMLACCHILHSYLWHARGETSSQFLQKILYCIEEAHAIWVAEQQTANATGNLQELMTSYAIAGRNARSPRSIYGLAVDTAWKLQLPVEAFRWAEVGKGQAFGHNLSMSNMSPQTSHLETAYDGKPLQPLSRMSALLVHWVIDEDDMFICASQNFERYWTCRLEITTSAVQQWHKDLVDAKDDLSNAECAAETLAELEPLCRPLFKLDWATKGQTLIFCPTGILFKIPIHAIPSGDGTCLIDHHPIAYTHSFSVLNLCLSKNERRHQAQQGEHTILVGNATGDTPGGETSVNMIAKQLKCTTLTGLEATKDAFFALAPSARHIHIHGHVLANENALEQSILFSQETSAKAKDFFKIGLFTSNPTIVLIGCGSGAERNYSGDEPLGLISAFLYGGASAVVATMWPIHDKLSGAAFSERFYNIHEGSNESHMHVRKDSQGLEIPEIGFNLATKVQNAILAIKAKKETNAPYFWAGFVLYGDWAAV